MLEVKTICVVGLGYVGLPLAVEFAEHFEVVGFDVSQSRIDELKQGKDSSREVEGERLKNPRLEFTSDPKDIKKAELVIICVPTPVDEHNRPDFGCLISASKTVGENLKQGSVVVYESTVYPGATEEVCLPVLEKASSKKAGEYFKIGYSPERVNPGDKKHTIDKIVKVVAGQDKETTEVLAAAYGKIITAGIHKAPNIKTAEAAKVIENTQRDLNIALMNELSKIFARLNIRTKDVLEAARTKWNFGNYYPGLVGGHCLGVDPYYLTYKAHEVGYHPEVILAGRRINDTMHQFVVEKLVKLMNKAGKLPSHSRVLVMGLTFKENVPDPRNSRIKYLIKELQDLGVEVFATDPLLKDGFIEKEFGVKNLKFADVPQVDAVVIASPHELFSPLTLDHLKNKMTSPPILVDIKAMFKKEEAEQAGFLYEEL